MFENARLSLSVARFIKSGIIISPKHMQQGSFLMKNHEHSIEEAMSFILSQCFVNNEINQDDLTAEGEELLHHGLTILNTDFNLKNRLFDKAIELAKKGDGNACFDLGVMYENGEGITQDLVEAVKWYKKSAELGMVSAQYLLGNAYALGLGVPQNYIFAYAWHNVASSQGSDMAAEHRDELRGVMTAQQIEKAQDLSNEYYEKYVDSK